MSKEVSIHWSYWAYFAACVVITVLLSMVDWWLGVAFFSGIIFANLGRVFE